MPIHRYKQPLELIQQASRLTYQISRPTAYPGVEDDQTLYSFGWTKHPEYEEYTADIPEDLEVLVNGYLHTDASSINGLINNLMLFYPDEQERQEKANLILNNEKIKIIELLPSYWQESTEEELRNEGWFE